MNIGSVKRNIRNICISYLFILLFDVVYTLLGLLVISHINIKKVPAVIVFALLFGLLYVGYLIGAKFFSDAKIKVVTIVIIPIILMIGTFGTSFLGLLVPSLLIQYPTSIILEALDVMNIAEHDMLFYIVIVSYHLLCCISLLIGSYHKKHTKEQ